MTPINGNEKNKKNQNYIRSFPILSVCVLLLFLALSDSLLFLFLFFSFRPLERNILSCGLAYSFGFSLFSRMELNMK